jgi:hypothetical protein
VDCHGSIDGEAWPSGRPQAGRPRRVPIYRARGRPNISPEHIKGNSSLGFFTGGKNAVQRCSTYHTLSLQGGFSIFHRDLMRILHLPLFFTLYTVGYIGHDTSSFRTIYYTISQVIPSQSLFYTTLPNFTLQQSICLHFTCRVLADCAHMTTLL